MKTRLTYSLTPPRLSRFQRSNGALPGIEQLRVFAAALDAVVRVGERRLRVVADLLVELLVLLGRDLALAARPQGRRLVDRGPLVLGDLLLRLAVPLLLLHQDRQRDVVGVLRRDRLQLPSAQELFLPLAQMQRDAGAALRAGDRLHLEIAAPFRAPAHALLGRQTGAARLDRQPVGDDEAAVESNAELADQLGVLLLVALERRHEFARPALRDGAEIRDRLGCRQADPVVGDRDRLGLRVEADAHFEVRLVLVERRVVQRLETQLVAGVRSIRDHLAQEDFLVRVERVGHEVQDLLDLGLE